MGVVSKRYETGYGIYEIQVEDEQVCVIHKVDSMDGAVDLQQVTSEDAGQPQRDLDVLESAYRQLEEYFAGVREVFSFAMNPQGTEFQRKVWNALREIPYGETRSYKEIAIAIGNPKACRAVGMANNANPIIIAIPCHRVIGASGKLVGYARGLEMKKHLLELEKRAR